MKSLPTWPPPDEASFEAELERLENVFANQANAPTARTQALVDAMRWCLQNQRPAPTWAVIRVVEAIDRYQDGLEPSIEASLGVTRPTKQRRTWMRRDPRTGLSAAARILLEVEGRRGSEPVDESLFERIGATLPAPMSAGAVKKTYYGARRDAAIAAEVAAFRRRYGIRR